MFDRLSSQLISSHSVSSETISEGRLEFNNNFLFVSLSLKHESLIKIFKLNENSLDPVEVIQGSSFCFQTDFLISLSLGNINRYSFPSFEHESSFVTPLSTEILLKINNFQGAQEGELKLKSIFTDSDDLLYLCTETSLYLYRPSFRFESSLIQSMSENSSHPLFDVFKEISQSDYHQAFSSLSNNNFDLDNIEKKIFQLKLMITMKFLHPY